MARWTCPECGRQFGRKGQGHECAPAMTIDEYFAVGPPHEKPVFDVVHPYVTGLGPDVYVEPVSVGIFFKLHSTFVQLRPMTKWVALSFRHPRKLTHAKISRKPVDGGGFWYHTVNLHSPDDFDVIVRGWLVEAYELESHKGETP